MMTKNKTVSRHPVYELDYRIFNNAYKPYVTDTTPLQIFYGGSSSGKSYFLAQRTVLDVAEGGRNYLICRKVQRYIKKSVFNEICKAIIELNLSDYFKINKSDFEITCLNGYQILFVGLDDVEKVKSITPQKGVITDIWIEEATEVSEADLLQLRRRLRGIAKYKKRVVLSFNPILKSHWIYTKFFSNWSDDQTEYRSEQLSILKTTYLDNIMHLSDDDIDILEDRSDEYFYNVYTLGNWGVIGNLIFKNYQIMDLQQPRISIAGITGFEEEEIEVLPQTFSSFNIGLDWGFSHDPAAVIKCHFDRKHGIIYVLDEIYEKELTNNLLADQVRGMIGTEYVVCDSAEPKSIKEFTLWGINALAARKGPGSINHGIDWLRRYTIIIDVRCINFKNEIMQYKYKEDKDGNVLKSPVDKNNHLMDAIRYAFEDEYIEIPDAVNVPM